MNSIIANWNDLLKTNSTPEMYESAFLRIYIEYESFIAETFSHFALGRSYGGYQPLRKLEFIQEDQLKDLIRGESSFVDYTKAIDRCSKHIFDKDPFGVLFSSANYNDDLIKMKLIRNYLAHRSIEAKDRYIRSVLMALNINDFVNPGEFLQKQVKSSGETYYTKYCKIFSEIYEFFHNDELLSNV